MTNWYLLLNSMKQQQQKIPTKKEIELKKKQAQDRRNG